MPAAEAIALLGEGWIAEEAVAIALYCAMSARDFEHGVRMAVNIDGDSDSTGAMTGNLVQPLSGMLTALRNFAVGHLRLRQREQAPTLQG